jgi:hypothetical protein
MYFSTDDATAVCLRHPKKTIALPRSQVSETLVQQLQSRHFKVVIGCSILIGASVAIGMAPNPSSKSDPRDQQWKVAIDPHKVIGYQACEKCHAAEIQTWKRTPHSETFLTLHRKPEAQQIANKLGIQNFKSDSNCIQCHYTMDHVDNRLEAIAGVSCESCHGAAQDWVSVHNDYGGPNVTRAQESAEHRSQRFLSSIQLGMRNPVNVYLIAQSCYRCHTVPDETLVNVGGHNAGSLDFEFVSWSQGTVRHNFVRTEGKSNAEESPSRLRIMFLSGMIADLEFSMRATAKATQKSTFGITSAQRTARAIERLKSAQEKVNQPILAEVLSIAQSVQLKLNNQSQLEDAASKINELGVRFGATVRGDELAAIDAFVPPKNKWK